MARWEPLTTARQGGECQGSSCYCAQRSGLHGLGCLMGQLRSHVSQTHFCGHQLGPACLPEECPGPHAGLQAVLTLMSACASGLFLPAQMPLDLVIPTPILPSPRLTPRGGNEASLIESLPQPPRESPSTKHVRTGPPSPRAKKPLPQTLNAPPPDPSPLIPVDIFFLWTLGGPASLLHTRSFFQNVQGTSLSLNRMHPTLPFQRLP